MALAKTRRSGESDKSATAELGGFLRAFHNHFQSMALAKTRRSGESDKSATAELGGFLRAFHNHFQSMALAKSPCNEIG